MQGVGTVPAQLPPLHWRAVPRLAAPCARLLPIGARSVPFQIAFTSSSISSTAAAATGGRSAVGTNEECATGDSPGALATPSTEDLVKFLKGKLPPYCCGCGVRLQQVTEDKPGFFRIPRKLLDFAAQQALLLGLEADSGAGAGMNPEERRRRALDRAAEQWLDQQQKPAEPRDSDDEEEDGPGIDVLCERCYTLKHEGKIKRPDAEALLPEFDLAKKVGRKIALQRDRRAVVLVVVDVADFDGSLPRSALRALFPPLDPLADPDKAPELPFKLMVAVNKFDLLPTQATARRVEQWVRLRLRQAGLPRPDCVFPVSAVSGFGVKEMLGRVRDEMGFRADLWVVGAQNAGKSSLINAMKRAGGTAGRGEATVAPVPGTTLGLLRVPGIPLGAKRRVFDTPGVRHSYQLTTGLPLRDVQAVLPRRRLKPRTWRLGEGSSILIGGLARVDVLESPGPTLYLTAFLSDDVTCHMGRTEGVEERRAKHAGGLLVPPLGPEGLEGLRPLVARDVAVSGGAWDRSSVDVAVAGLGWVAAGVKGEAMLRVWVPEGVAVTVHDALIPDFAKQFERPGWSDLLPAKNRARMASGSSGGREAGGISGAEEEDEESAPAPAPAAGRAPRERAAGGRSSARGGGGGRRGGGGRSGAPPRGRSRAST